jgi:hypothetical protein
MAVHHQDTCLATHSNMNFIYPSPWKNPIMTLRSALGLAGLPGGYPKDEMDALASSKEFQVTGAGYHRIQGTRPQVMSILLLE